MMTTQAKNRFMFFYSRWATAIVITHLWSFVTFFYALPAIVRKMSISETLALFSYNQAFAFIESIFLTIAILVLQRTLSIGTEKNHPMQYLVLTTGFALIFVLIHFIDELSDSLFPLWHRLLNSISPHSTTSWVNSPAFLFAFFSVLVLILSIYTLIISRKVLNISEHSKSNILQLMDKVNMLALFYLFVDFIGLVNVALRNIK